MNGPRAAGRTTASPRRRRAASSASRRRARVATVASEDRLATRRAACARPPGALARAAGEAIGHRARDHARRPKPPSDAPRKCRRGRAGRRARGFRRKTRARGRLDGRRTARRTATSSWAGPPPAPWWFLLRGRGARASDSARRARQTRRARRADGAQFPTGRMLGWSGLKRRARGSGRRDARRALGDARERGDEGARVDREEIERARRPTGVDNGRARQRRRARPIREISAKSHLGASTGAEAALQSIVGPAERSFRASLGQTARLTARPLASAPRGDTLTARSSAERMARATRSPPPHLRPAQNRIVGKASNGKVGGSKTRPDFAHESVVDGDHACRHRFADDAQSQRVLNWLTVYPYGIANSKRGPRNRRGSELTIVRNRHGARFSQASRAPRPSERRHLSRRGAPSRDETTMSAVACASPTTAPVATPTRVRAPLAPRTSRPARARAPRSRAPPTPTTDP